MKKNNSATTQTERFSPDYTVGLNQNQVETRISEELTNVVKKRYSKSYSSIVVGNVCTFFNLLGLVVFIALLCVKAELFEFVFVIVYLANLAIGITQEIRAKKSIDRLSLFYVQQGDIIYVTPNDKRRRESTINGNNVRSSSFWISIGSLATSVALLIFRLK